MPTSPRRIAWIAAALALGFVGLLALRTRATIGRLEGAQRERAAMVAHALVATVQGVARHGPDATTRVQAVFEELSASELVRVVALLDEDGAVVVDGGAAPPDMTGLRPWGDGLLREGRDTVTVQLPFQLQAGHGMGVGPGARARRGPGTLGSGAYALYLELDGAAALGVRAHILSSDLALLVIGMALAVLGVLLVRSQAANHALQARVALQEQRRRSLESLRLLAAGLAHETKNPLGAIRGNAQLLLEASEAGEARERAALVLAQIDQVTDRLDEFLSFARQRKPRLDRVDLAQVAKAVVDLLEPDAAAAGVTLTLTAQGDTSLTGDPRQLQEALFNLALNALQACAAGDTVRLELTSSAEAVTAAVVDDGPGIAVEDMARLTEPYFTTREAGSGLGLTIVERIAEAHGARLGVQSVVGEGSRFELVLPREPPRDL
ncbi:MAG: ATP-binding protein [Pseudomonadota bacterium]